MKKKHLAIAAMAIVGSLLFAAAASASTTTIGATLPATPAGEALECPPETIEGCGVVAGDAVSPVSGEVTGWRMQGAGAGAGYALDVVRLDNEEELTITAASAPVTSTGPELQMFSTALPIAAGEYLAVITPEGGSVPLLEEEAPTALFFGGPVGSNAELITPLQPFAKVGLSADIEVPDVTPPAPEKEVVTKMEVVTKTVEVPAKPGPQCKVPKLTGKTLAAAKKSLKAARCKVGFVIRPRGAKGARAKVKRTVPKPGTSLPAGTPVSIKLG